MRSSRSIMEVDSNENYDDNEKHHDINHTDLVRNEMSGSIDCDKIDASRNPKVDVGSLTLIRINDNEVQENIKRTLILMEFIVAVVMVYEKLIGTILAATSTLMWIIMSFICFDVRTKKQVILSKLFHVMIILVIFQLKIDQLYSLSGLLAFSLSMRILKNTNDNLNNILLLMSFIVGSVCMSIHNVFVLI